MILWLCQENYHELPAKYCPCLIILLMSIHARTSGFSNNDWCLFFYRLKLNHDSHEFILEFGAVANSNHSYRYMWSHVKLKLQDIKLKISQNNKELNYFVKYQALPVQTKAYRLIFKNFQTVKISWHWPVMPLGILWVSKRLWRQYRGWE
jgi:hypothetical protein